MIKPRVLILRAPGTNCDQESAHAFELAGAVTKLLHVNRILEQPAQLASFQVICIPGGFSYGDDIAAGRILGNQIHHHLADALQEFHDSEKLILGICNGFQVLLKTSLLAKPDRNGPTATLTLNDCGHFEARWVTVGVTGGNCVFLKGIESIDLPVAHAEGKFVTRDDATFAAMEQAGQLVLRYRTTPWQRESKESDDRSIGGVNYPANPNGAMGDVAGVCDRTGRVFGLMPHPERFVDPTQHPTWTRGPNRKFGDGLRVFQNAVQYFE